MASIFRNIVTIQQVLEAQKRSLVRFIDLNSTGVKKSSAVKLSNGNGPLLEVKRDGVPMKKHHANLEAWFSTLPAGAHKKLFLQPVSLPLPRPGPLLLPTTSKKPKSSRRTMA